MSGIDLVHDPLGLALGRIKNGWDVDASIVAKDKDLHKWGYLASTSTSFQTVQLIGGTETVQTSNTITGIKSTSGSDTQVVRVEGHYLDADDDKVFTVQFVTLTGTTFVTFSTPLARVSRMNIETDNPAVGTIAATQGDGGTVHANIEATGTQTEKAATSMSYRDFFILTDFGGSMVGNNNFNMRFRLETKTPTGPWRPIARFSLRGAGDVNYHRILPVPMILPPNSDIRMRALASGTGEAVSAHFDGILAADLAYATDGSDDLPAA